jgi:hypothetical protein
MHGQPNLKKIITIHLEENLWWLISFKLCLSLSHKYLLYWMSATAYVEKISATSRANRNNQPVERWKMRAGNYLFSLVRNSMNTGTFYIIFRQ